MKKDLIIVGAGSVGGFLALNQNLFEENFNIIGFLDDDENKQGKSFWGIKVIGNVDDMLVLVKSVIIQILFQVMLGFQIRYILVKVLSYIQEYQLITNQRLVILL